MPCVAMSQATSAVTVAVSRAAQRPVPGSPSSGDGRKGAETSVRVVIRRLSTAGASMEAVDMLIRSAVDAKEALGLFLTGSFHAQNLRQGIDMLVLPLLTGITNCCVFHAARTALPLADFPAVTFDELGFRVTLSAFDALDGLMCSLTSEKPPMACFYGVRPCCAHALGCTRPPPGLRVLVAPLPPDCVLCAHAARCMCRSLFSNTHERILESTRRPLPLRLVVIVPVRPCRVRPAGGWGCRPLPRTSCTQHGRTLGRSLTTTAAECS